MTKEKGVVRGSGNVYADLGYRNPEEQQTKASLVSQIADIIEEREMTQADAAGVFGIDQPKVSALLNGRFRGFSVYRLLAFIAALGATWKSSRKVPVGRFAKQPDRTDHRALN